MLGTVLLTASLAGHVCEDGGVHHQWVQRDGARAYGLVRPHSPVWTPEGCADVCCADEGCSVWQWGDGDGKYDGCWVGDWSRRAGRLDFDDRAGPGWVVHLSEQRARAVVEQGKGGGEEVLGDSLISFCNAEGWEQVWADDFDGDSLDMDSWSYDLNGGDSSVRDSLGLAENVVVANGSLVITSHRRQVRGFNYTSGAINTAGKRSWKGHTRVCVSAILPGGGGEGKGDGIWPAHWMMPETKACWPTAGEIDIMEMIDGVGTLYGTYHYSTKCGKNNQTGGNIWLPSDWASAYHEYSVEYNDTHISFAVDNKVYFTTHASDIVPMFDVSYHMILNTAVSKGGVWPKPATPVTVFPTYHYIDYVVVSQPEGSAAPRSSAREDAMDIAHGPRQRPRSQETMRR